MTDKPARRSQLTRPLTPDDAQALVEKARAAGADAFPDGLPSVQPADMPPADWHRLGTLSARRPDTTDQT